MKNALCLVRFRLAVFSLLLSCMLLASGWASAEEPGGTPEAGGDVGAVELLPVRLGLPDGCHDALPYALNNGTYPQYLVVGLGMWCETTPGWTDFLPAGGRDQ